MLIIINKFWHFEKYFGLFGLFFSRKSYEVLTFLRYSLTLVFIIFSWVNSFLYACNYYLHTFFFRDISENYINLDLMKPVYHLHNWPGLLFVAVTSNKMWVTAFVTLTFTFINHFVQSHFWNTSQSVCCRKILFSVINSSALLCFHVALMQYRYKYT